MSIENGHPFALSIFLNKIRVLTRKRDTMFKSLKMRRAAAAGEAEKVKILIEQGADPNSTSNTGRTALHRAAKQGHAQVVECLVELGADVNKTEEQGLTPFNRAAKRGHVEVGKALIRAGADINLVARKTHVAPEENSNIQTPPIIRAAMHNRASFISLILNEANESSLSTALYIAIFHDHFESAQLLLSSKKLESELEFHLVRLLRRKPKSKMVQLLIHHGANIFLNSAYQEAPTKIRPLLLTYTLEYLRDITDGKKALPADTDKFTKRVVLLKDFRGKNKGEEDFKYELNTLIPQLEAKVNHGYDIVRENNNIPEESDLFSRPYVKTPGGISTMKFLSAEMVLSGKFDVSNLAEVLSKYPDLVEKLVFNDNNLTETDYAILVPSLSACTNLKSLSIITNRISTNAMKALVMLINIESLTLTENKMGNSELNILAQGLEINKKLRSLSLEDTTFGIKGLTGLCKSLVGHHSLEELNFDNNKLGDNGVMLVVNLMLKNEKITRLSLNSNKVTDKGIRLLAPLLSQGKRLEKLFLKNNKFGDSGLQQLTEFVASSSSIREIDISGCHCSKMLLRTFIESALKRPSLEVLGLGDCQLGSEEARFIATLLPSSRLKKLDISDNKECRSEINAILQAANTHQLLESLVLDSNGVGDEATEDIAVLLRINQHVNNIGLAFNTFTIEGINKIVEAVEERDTPVTLELWRYEMLFAEWGGIKDKLDKIYELKKMRQAEKEKKVQAQSQIEEGQNDQPAANNPEPDSFASSSNWGAELFSPPNNHGEGVTPDSSLTTTEFVP